MVASLELVSFLARSENRVEALLGLQAGPMSRADLQAETGIPRATLSRILADFGERGLVERRGHEFSVTPLGELLATELQSLAGSLGVVEELQALDPWLPWADVDFATGDLVDASVTLPTRVDPLAPVRRTAEVLGSSDRVRGMCNNVVPAILEALRRAVDEDSLTVDVVVTGEAFGAVAADPAVSEVVGGFLDTAHVDVAVFDGEIPMLAIDADGRVLLEVAEDGGAIRGLVETGDDAVRAWFDGAFDAYRRDAEPAVPERLTA